MLRPDRSVARQAREIEQRIDGVFRVQLLISPIEVTESAPRSQELPPLAEARSADITVFSSNIAIVMGPTPPGTGVIHDAVPSQLWKSTSPVSLPSASRLMPTSMTTAPGFTMLAVTRLGLPAATTRTSAWPVIAPKSGVLELQMVTVAPFCKSSSAIGLPTMLLRPTTTAWRPRTPIPSCSSSFLTPRGVHCRKRGDTPNQSGAQIARDGVAVNDAGLHGRESARRARAAHSSIRGFPALVQPADAISLIARGAFSYNAKCAFIISDRVQLIL